jgi:signal transduction histidine kinase
MPNNLILIAVENKVNGQLLQDALKQYHTVKVADSEVSISEPFDLGIFDGVSLKRLQKQVLARQARQPDLFLPILLVTTRQDIGMVTRQLWKAIDEIIFTPIEKVELLARVQVLLRAHNYSAELARLYKEAHEQATYAERQRLARELHDSVTQMIFSASTLAQTLPQVQKKSPERAQAQLEEVVRMNRAALSEMRTLLMELRPQNLLRTSLKDLFDQLILGVQGRRDVKISCTVEGVTILPEDLHLGVYRIVQEALNNIVKHSEATEAHVSLTIHDEQLNLHIQDNGDGFNVKKHSTGLGLDSMRERANLMGARMTISSAKGAGTEIFVSMPIPNTILAEQ